MENKSLNIDCSASFHRLVKKCSTFALIAHARPDGDTVGAELALLSYLGKLGKKVTAFSRFPVPQQYQFLSGWRQIKVTEKIKGHFDVLIVLECNSIERAGNIIDPKQQAGITVNIDHHYSFELFGELNWIETESAATCEQLFILLTNNKRRLSKNEALYLYTGLITDTGCLMQANVTSRTLSIASELLKYGIDMEDVKNKIYNDKELGAFHFLGHVLRTLKTYHDGKIAVMQIPANTYRKFNVDESDTEGFIDYGRKVKGVEISCLFRESEASAKSRKQTDKSVKVSFRSNGRMDMNRFASRFGGGGHKRASGCTLNMGLDRAVKTILKALSVKY